MLQLRVFLQTVGVMYRKVQEIALSLAIEL